MMLMSIGCLDNLLDLASQYNIDLLNLENLVPPEDWGLKDSTDISGEAGLDFMHFQKTVI